MFQAQANWFGLHIQQFMKSKHCYLKCLYYSFPVLETIHPNPKATEAAGEEGGEVEEQVIGEVWESQDEMVDGGEDEVEGEEEQEESDGEFEC